MGRRDVEADARIDGAGGGGGGGGGEGSGGGGSNALVETGTYLVGSETGGVFKCFLNFAALHEKVCVCVCIYIYYVNVYAYYIHIRLCVQVFSQPCRLA